MLYTAFILGLSSSLHCVGMCGPLALALPTGKTRVWQLVPGRLAYQIGRVVTYVLLGALLGLFGEGISIAGYQQSFSLLLGVGLIIMAIGSFSVESGAVKIPWINRGLLVLRKHMSHWLGRGESYAMFNLGILNGFLPCGFVYLALAGAVSTGEFTSSMAYMALFGLGTWPAMLSMSLGKLFLPNNFRKWARPLMLGMTLVLGSLLIIRGLGLGIPYLSPEVLKDVATGSEVVNCH